jgi:hypothetical protein
MPSQMNGAGTSEQAKWDTPRGKTYYRWLPTTNFYMGGGEKFYLYVDKTKMK